jgi:cyclic nucleotide-binding protein
MDLLGRFFSGRLDSFRKPPDDSTPQDPAKRGDPVKLTLWGRRFKLQLEILRSARADEAAPGSGSSEDIPVPRDEDRADLSVAAEAPESSQASSVSPEPRPRQEQAAPREARRPPDSFWDVLEPTEREALRAVASLRTFAAGARLMEEGQRADYVMVILGGRVEICIYEDGTERVVAIRGLGQLVGERAALEISLRSATVIALDMIWALVVHTKDFAAFISAHPRVLGIVQNQLDQRRIEDPAGDEHGTVPLPPESASGMAEVSQPDDDHKAGHSRRRSRRLNGENCTVFLTDVVGFGARTRTDNDRLLIREVLFRMTQAAVQGMPGVRTEDRGDGFLTVVPPNVSTARVIGQLLKDVPSALELHNSTHRESARFKLRLAVNVGPVVSDMGVSGEAIIVAARLVEAPHFKAAIAASPASLGVIASPFVYETVIRHGADPRDVASYSEVPVEVKESDTTAWMKLFEAPPSPLVPHPAGPESYVDPLTPSLGAGILPGEQRLDAGQAFPEVFLGGGLARLGQGQPAQRGVGVFGADRAGGLGGHEVPDVGVLVRRFSLASGNVDDDHVPDRGVRPRRQVGQAGLLPRFPPRDGERVGLPRIAVAAHLQPGLLALMPAQQHPAGGRVHDQRGRGDVQREIAPVRIGGGPGQRPHPADVSRLGVTLRLVAVQERGQRRPRGVRCHRHDANGTAAQRPKR